MAVCELCGKYGRSGHTVSHSKHRTKTRFLPNVQRATLYVGGQKRRVKVCTRCLRTLYKQVR